MRKSVTILSVLVLTLLLNGCLPEKKAEETPKPEVVQTIITPELPSGEKTYRTSLPYLPSQTKGTVASTNHRIDLDYMDMGLLELAQTQLDPDEVLFQEGQVISTDDVEDWLGRYHAEKNRLGLNPETGSNELIQIVEHDYLDLKTKELTGMVIGLSVPSVLKNAEGKEQTIDSNLQREKVKIFGGKIVERIRAMKVDIPILVAGYSLEPSTSVVPGHLINYGVADRGEGIISGWKDIDEHYLLFPGRLSTTENEKEFGSAFIEFQKKVQEFFAQYAGVTGLTRFRSDEPVEMAITVRANYSSKTEVISLTQYIAGIIPDYFPDNIKIYVYIESVDRSEAIYVRPVKGDPFFHIYR